MEGKQLEKKVKEELKAFKEFKRNFEFKPKEIISEGEVYTAMESCYKKEKIGH